MEHLNEDLQPRMMPDFKFYKGLSFTRKKNDEYFTWSEILYGSILKMNGATHISFNTFMSNFLAQKD